MNVVFIPSIDLGDGRSNKYNYCINSWKYWCNKNDCELLIWEDLLLPVENMPIVWQRYYVFNILVANEIKYDQVLLVDSDTIIHPNCPNFFDKTDGKYTAVINDGCYEWVNRSISQWGPKFFNKSRFPTWKYVNGGFQIFNKNHKDYLEYLLNWYEKNVDSILQVIGKFNSGDQTCINFLREEYNLEMTILPSCYNLQDISRKNLMYLHPQHWWTDELHYLKNGWIYHFNAIPQNEMGRDANYWIERTYRELYKKT
tara:strand:- start:862 stop:1629 length:768 start_codon:yes stop_codon:yes gene_type:complete